MNWDQVITNTFSKLGLFTLCYALSRLLAKIMNHEFTFELVSKTRDLAITENKILVAIIGFAIGGFLTHWIIDEKNRSSSN